MHEASKIEVRWANLAAPELRALAEQGTVVLWPVGSTEQHGAHLVSGFDLAAATAVVEHAAARVAPRAVVLPGLAYGSSDHWLALGATLSLRPETLTAVIRDVARSVREAGFGHLILVNGHAGNLGPALAALGVPPSAGLVVEFVSYWTLADPASLVDACRTDGGGIGHAGEVETSIALHLGGGLLVEGRTATTAGAPLGGDMPGSSRTVFLRAPAPLDESPFGVYGDPRQANAALGALVIEQAAIALADHCVALTDGR